MAREKGSSEGGYFVWVPSRSSSGRRAADESGEEGKEEEEEEEEDEEKKKETVKVPSGQRRLTEATELKRLD